MAGNAVAAETARLRRAVAAATRTLNHLGVLGYSGHIGARLPDGERFLIQPFDRSRAEVTPDDLVVVGLDGRPVEKRNDARPPDEVFIHSEILKARPDVQAVFHFHPETAILFTMVEGVSLAPVKNHAARWASGVPVHPIAAKIATQEMGAALAASLGPHNAVLLRAHGAVVVAESVAALAIDAIHFVENAETAYRAAMLGRLRPLGEDEMAEITAHQHRAAHVAKLWDYYTGQAVRDGAVPAEWL